MSALVACGGGGAPGTAATLAPTVRANATVDTARPAGDPGVTIANVIQACREKDGDRLRSFVAGAVDDGELRGLFARGDDVLLQTQTIDSLEDGHATATVGLKIRRDGSTEQVRRTWQLEQGDDGVWRLAGLPDCY